MKTALGSLLVEYLAGSALRRAPVALGPGAVLCWNLCDEAGSAQARPW